MTMNKKPVSGQNGQDGLFASSVWDRNTKEYIVKIANTSDSEQPVTVTFAGWKTKSEVIVQCITLHSDDMDAENTLDNPNKIVPQQSQISLISNVLDVKISPKTFVVYRFAK